jgi:signal transduction histidine kinase
VYRVVRQALDNIEHHARASRVVVTLGQANGRIEFEISDDGRGFSETDRANAEYHGHFGLRFMDSRLRELGGALTVLSIPNKGTRIVGWLPADA